MRSRAEHENEADNSEWNRQIKGAIVRFEKTVLVEMRKGNYVKFK